MTRIQDLGVRPVINAAATLTRLGGSRMPAAVVEAMRAAYAGKWYHTLTFTQKTTRRGQDGADHEQTW